MEKKERLIDLKQYFIQLYKHIWIVLLTALVFMIALTGYGYKKQVNSMNSGSISAIVKQNKSAFTSSATLYTDMSKPSGTYNSRVGLLVDLDFSSALNNDNPDLHYLVSSSQKNILQLAVNYTALNEVIEELHLRDYQDMEDLTAETLYWMVNKNFASEKIMNLVVTDTDPERANKIVNALSEKLIKNAKEFFDNTEISVLDEATLEKRETPSISKKGLLKYTIVGFAGGFIVAAGLYLLFFLFKDAVLSDEDLSYSGTSLFGSVNKKTEEADYKKLAMNLSVKKNVNKVLLIALDEKAPIDETITKLSSSLKSLGSEITVSGDAYTNGSCDILKKIKENDALLYVTSKGVLSVDSLKQMVGTFNEADIKKLGTVLISK